MSKPEQLPPRDHNQPPDPIDAALDGYGDAIEEAENWLDGTQVETEEQMKAVDAIAAEIKGALKSAKTAEESATKPLYDAWKTEKARWKPTLDDLERIKKGLAKLVSDFKRKLAEQREAERRAAEAAARKAREEAEAKARAASEADIEAQREAAAAQASTVEATKATREIEKVKGLRTVTRYRITDHRALLHWIAANRKDDMTAFIEEWARRNHRHAIGAEGLNVWTEKEAY